MNRPQPAFDACLAVRNPPTADELRQWAADPAGNGMVPVHPATLRALVEVVLNAARYQWIREQTSAEQDARGRQQFVMPDPHPLSNLMHGSVALHLDMAIDGEMVSGTTGKL